MIPSPTLISITLIIAKIGRKTRCNRGFFVEYGIIYGVSIDKNSKVCYNERIESA